MPIKGYSDRLNILDISHIISISSQVISKSKQDSNKMGKDGHCHNLELKIGLDAVINCQIISCTNNVY